MTETLRIGWKPDVEEKHYQAALAYLSLRYSDRMAETIVQQLRDSEVVHRRVNDILRACDRQPLPLTDPGVLNTLIKVASGKPLAPVLVVSNDIGGDIADGYHRCSLVYQLDPFAIIPLRLAS